MDRYNVLKCTSPSPFKNSVCLADRIGSIDWAAWHRGGGEGLAGTGDGYSASSDLS